MILGAWTPGPWSYRPLEYDGWGTVRGAPDAEGRQWIVCRARLPYCSEESLSEHRRNGTDPWEADALLISAAPELFEALDGLLVAYCDSSSTRAAKRNACDKARAALAKAEGR